MPKEYDITIPQEIIDDLVRIEKEMSKILEDDDELFDSIMGRLLMYGKKTESGFIVSKNYIAQSI